MNVRRAVAGEGGIVAEMIRACVPPSMRELTIWHSPSVENYVESRLRDPDRHPESRFYLLTGDRGEPIGVAEFRRLEESAFLNHIYVSAPCRGKSLGQRMLEEAARDFLRCSRVSRVMLDVEPRNRLACEWYQRLGFRAMGQTCWQLGSLKPNGANKGVVTGWDAAEDMQERFGFSRFTVETPHGRYWVGRLGKGYFRFTAAEPWRDSHVHGALGNLDPARRILMLSQQPLEDLEIVRRSERLAVDAESLLRSFR